MSRQSFAFSKSVALELTIALSIFIKHFHFFEAVKRVYQNKRTASYPDPVNDPKLIKENDRESTIQKCTRGEKKSDCGMSCMKQESARGYIILHSK